MHGVGEPNLEDIARDLKNKRHELEQLASTRPANGAEITLAMRKVQEAIMYVEEAQQKANK